MRMDDERGSDNVEDQRGQGGFRFPGGGKRIRMGGRSGGLGIGGIVIILILSFVFGINPLEMLFGGGGGGGVAPKQVEYQQPKQTQNSPSQDEMKTFISKVLGTTERTWQKVFAQQGMQYKAPRPGIVFRLRAVRLWGCPSSYGAVLLSTGQQGLH